MKKYRDYIKSIVGLLLSVGGAVVAVAVGIWGLKFFMPFVIGWIIALIANPLVRFAERKLRIVRKHSSVLIIIVVLAAITGCGYFVVVKAAREFMAVIQQAPEISKSFGADFQEVQKNLSLLIRELPAEVQQSIADFQSDIGSRLAALTTSVSQWTVSWAGDFAKSVPDILIGVIFTILSAYFFIADRDKILEFGRANTPIFIQTKWRLLADNFCRVLGGYLKAQLKIMCVIWVILTAGFFVLEVRFAAVLALLVAFLDMLPIFGTGTALIPWALFKVLSGDIRMAVSLLIIYGITQLVRRLIEPKLVGDSIGIAPLSTLVFMYAGYKLSGVLGMILAVPIGAIVINFYRMGIFDQPIQVSKNAMEDFYYWLRPQERQYQERKEDEEKKNGKEI